MTYTAAKIDLDATERHLHGRGWDEIMRAGAARTPADRYLLARAALASQKTHHMSHALEVLGDARDHSTLGMRAILLAQMGEALDALGLDIDTPPRSRVDLDGAYWLAFAHGIALTDTRCYTEALVAFGKALVLADLLGLVARNQIVRLHIRAVENQMGQTNTAAILRELNEPMPALRRKWAVQNYVASLLQRGEYDKAYKAAEPGTYWQAMAGALAGRPQASGGDSAYFRGVQAWYDLIEGKPVELVTGLRGGIIAEYARLAVAARMARQVATAQHVIRILPDEPPPRPDQAAIWATVMLQALTRGAALHDPLALSGIQCAALDQLSSTFDVINVLERVAPEGLLLAAYGPSAHADIVYIRIGAVERALVKQEVNTFLNGYRGEEFEAGKLPNLGAVLAGIEVMRNVAMDENKRGLVKLWEGAEAEMRWELTPPLRNALETMNSPCAPLAGGHTLDA